MGDRYCMCMRNGESMDHFHFYCNVAYTIWIAFFSRFELSWVMPRLVVDLYACWWTTGSALSAAVWMIVLTRLVVFMEENELYKLCGPWEDFWGDLVFFLQNFVPLDNCLCFFFNNLVISLFFLFLLVRCFILYTSCVLRGAFTLLMIFVDH